MTRKSAAQLKPKFEKEHVQDLPPIEETFENAKQAFINTLEVSIILAERVDNLLNIRDYAIGFWKQNPMYLDNMTSKDRMRYYRHLQGVSIKAYQLIRDATETFELDEFLKEDMKDYYEDIIPNVDDIEDEAQLCQAGLIFLTVKPFGEKMTQLHKTILDEKRQRDYQEKTDD